jgi:hypothetical protein
MNHRQLFKRIKALDSLYLTADRLTWAWIAEKDPEARQGLMDLADKFWARYQRLVNDRRRTEA